MINKNLCSGCVDHFEFCHEMRDLCQPKLTHVDSAEEHHQSKVKNHNKTTDHKKCNGDSGCLPG